MDSGQLMTDPSPAPTGPGQILQSIGPDTLLSATLLLLVLFAMGVGLTWAILRAARHAPPTMLIIVMSLLTIVLVGVYVFVDQEAGTRQVISTMAATSLGALVTAMSSSFTKNRQNGSDSEKVEVPVEEEDEL